MTYSRLAWLMGAHLAEYLVSHLPPVGVVEINGVERREGRERVLKSDGPWGQGLPDGKQATCQPPLASLSVHSLGLESQTTRTLTRLRHRRSRVWVHKNQNAREGLWQTRET